MSAALTRARVVLFSELVLIRDLFAVLLEKEGAEVLASTGDSSTFLTDLDRWGVQVAIVCSLQAAGLGARALADASRRHPEIPRVFLLQDGSATERAEATAAGASALVDLFTEDGRRFIAAVASVIAPLGAGEAAGEQPDPLGLVTNREREVLGHVATGADNLKIAVLLGISERTVKAHLGALYAKLGHENRVQLALFAHAHGLVAAAS